jgi:hypothetical protein
MLDNRPYVYRYSEMSHRGVDRRSLCGYLPYKLRRSDFSRHDVGLQAGTMCLTSAM